MNTRIQAFFFVVLLVSEIAIAQHYGYEGSPDIENLRIAKVSNKQRVDAKIFDLINHQSLCKNFPKGCECDTIVLRAKLVNRP